MKLDKKVLYRHICMLQSFRAAYNVYEHHKTDGTSMFEVRKLIKDGNGNMCKFTSFALSTDRLPSFVEFDSIINYDVILMTNDKINQYVSQCKAYGIL